MSASGLPAGSAPLSTVAILYGMGEGPLLSKRFRHLLEQQGFCVIPDTTQADIIVAHSAGAWFIPARRAAKSILIVGPAVGYEGSKFWLEAHKVQQDYRGAIAKRRLAAWLIKSFYNVSYLLLQPRILARIYREAKRQSHALPVIHDAKVGVITLRDDRWSSSVGEKGLYADLSYTFLNFDHLHDDLWAHPEEYISVLQYLHAS